jgi:hypothetical protein
MSAAAVLIRTTSGGHRVEVIAGRVCLDGRPEADALTVLDEHPNRAAILRAVPRATHVAGRLPLTLAEASVAQVALRASQDRYDGSPQGVRKRIRRAEWIKTLADGAE